MKLVFVNSTVSEVILKMARLTKDGSFQGLKEFVSQAPSRTLNIPGKELVQVIAKVCFVIHCQ